MNEQELRALRALTNELRALREQIHSIYEQQQASDAHRSEQPVRPFPVEVQTEAVTQDAVREYYRSENRERESWWGRNKRWIETGGVVAAFAISGLTLVTFLQVKKQTEIGITQSRPWIKVIDVTLNDTETLTFDSSRMPLAPGETLSVFAPSRPNPISRVAVRGSLRLKNIGKSVAQNIRAFPEIFVIPPSTHGIDTEQKRFCEDGLKRGVAEAAQFSRSALFPDDECTVPVTATGWVYRGDTSKIDGTDMVDVVLIGCIGYQQPQNFQTRVAYLIAGKSSRMIEFGKPLTANQIRFLRDEHAEYAQ